MSRARLVSALVIGMLALGASGAVGTTPAGAKVKEWSYQRLAQGPDTDSVRVGLGGGYAGRAKFIDNLVAVSRRFGNAQGKKRKRLYRVSGALSVRLKDGYKLVTAACKTRVARGQLVPLKNGTRAFYPQEAEEAPESAGGANVGLNLGPFSVEVPVPGLDLYSGTKPPSVSWAVPDSSSRHAWLWFFNPVTGDPPQAELLPFLGHWVTAAKGVHYRVVCKLGVSGYGADGITTVRVSRKIKT